LIEHPTADAFSTHDPIKLIDECVKNWLKSTMLQLIGDIGLEDEKMGVRGTLTSEKYIESEIITLLCW